MKATISILLLFALASHTSLHAQRIITAGSAITETVCALGDCDKIIASDRTSLYPEQIQKLPSIGYRSGISAEGILSLRPSLVIAEKEYVDDAVLEQLKAAKVELLIIDRKFSVDDTRTFIQNIAVVLKREAEGKKLIAAIDAELAEVNQLLKRTTSQPKAACIYNRGINTMSIAGAETFGNILYYVQCKNVFAGVQGYKPLNTEAIVAANPEYFVMVSSGLQSIGGIEGMLTVPGVAQTTAGKKKQIVAIDALMLTNFGPRVAKAIKT